MQYRTIGPCRFVLFYTERAISKNSRPGLADVGGGYEDSLVTRAITFSRRAPVTRLVDPAPGVLVVPGFYSEVGAAVTRVVDPDPGVLVGSGSESVFKK